MDRERCYLAASILWLVHEELVGEMCEEGSSKKEAETVMNPEEGQLLWMSNCPWLEVQEMKDSGRIQDSA